MLVPRPLLLGGGHARPRHGIVHGTGGDGRIRHARARKPQRGAAVPVDEARRLERVADDGEGRRPRAERGPEEREAEEDVVVGVERAVLDEDLVGGGRAGEEIPVVVRRGEVGVALRFRELCLAARRGPDRSYRQYRFIRMSLQRNVVNGFLRARARRRRSSSSSGGGGICIP